MRRAAALSTRTVSAAAALAALTLTAGCGSSGHGGGNGRGPGSAAQGLHVAAAPSPLPTPQVLTHASGAISSVSDLHCTAGPDGQWSATGVLHNRNPNRTVYAVDFDVLVASNGAVQARAQQEYTLAGGGTEQIRIERFYQGAATGLACVPNVREAPA